MHGCVDKIKKKYASKRLQNATTGDILIYKNPTSHDITPMIVTDDTGENCCYWNPLTHKIVKEKTNFNLKILNDYKFISCLDISKHIKEFL